MGAGAVKAACDAARAGGCEPDVDYDGEYRVDWTTKLGTPGVEHPIIHSTFGYAAQLVIVDRESGDIERVVAVHDVGRAVNPLLCEGQIEGSVHMGLGYALTEDFPADPDTGFPTPMTLRQLASCGRRTCRRSRSCSSSRRSRTRRTASRASARSASCRPPGPWPPRSTTSTASGARRCRCAAPATE